MNISSHISEPHKRLVCTNSFRAGCLLRCYLIALVPFWCGCLHDRQRRPQLYSNVHAALLYILPYCSLPQYIFLGELQEKFPPSLSSLPFEPLKTHVNLVVRYDLVVSVLAVLELVLSLHMYIPWSTNYMYTNLASSPLCFVSIKNQFGLVMSL